MKEKMEREMLEKTPGEAVRDDLAGSAGEAAEQSQKAKDSETQLGDESVDDAVDEHWQSK